MPILRRPRSRRRRALAVYDVARYDQAVYVGGASVPFVPQAVTVTATSSSATITWTPPTSDGGSTITSYRVARDSADPSDGGPLTVTMASSSRSYTFTGLIPGETYSLTVWARNQIGEGTGVTASVVIAAATGANVPTAPTSGSVYAPSTSQATVTWAPPASDGGSPITGYRVSRDGVATSGTANYATTVAATVRSFTMNLLYPGQTYNLSVAAINAVGTGPAYTGSVTIPGTAPTTTVPDVPTSVARTAPTSTTATISWAAPADNGGSAITGYRVTSSSGGGFTTTVGATTLSYSFTGLASNTVYTLSVAAINAVGQGPADTDDVVTPASTTGPTVPGVPVNVIGSSPSTSQATITWDPPTSNGGSAITGYRVSRDGTATSGTGAYTTVVDVTARSFTMNLLYAGQVYNLSVAAINANGDGPAATVSVTVGGATGVPTVPTSVTRTSPDTSSATITWAPPTSDGGSAITGYRVSRNGTSTTGTGAFSTVVAATVRTYTMGLLTSGATYTLTVAAINANGDGPASSGSVTVASDAGTGSGASMPTADLADFTMLFTDDFSVDAAAGEFLTKYTRWRAYPNTYKDTSGHGTYDPKIITVTNSIMDMGIRYESSTGRFLCAAPEPKINGSGARGQKYGRYAFRFRVPAQVAGYKTAWLLWPDSNLNAEGEIDFPEGDLDGGYTIRAFSHDVQGVHSHNAFAANSGVVYAGTGWHTGVIEWRPTGVTFFLDGKNLGTTPKLGTPVTAMHWILQTETQLGSSLPPTSANGHVQVDWVAVWKYTPGSVPGGGTPPPPDPGGGTTAPAVALNQRIVGVGGITSTKTTNASTVRLKVGTDAAVTQNVVYSPAATPNSIGWAKHTVSGLTAGTRYYYRVAMTDANGVETLDASSQVGAFRMPPTGATSFAFCFGSCSNVVNPAAYATIAARDDDLFLQVGDLWYADGSGVTLSNYRAKMQAQVAAANFQAIVADTPLVYTPSDHDFGMNNNTTGGESTTARDYYNQTYREIIPAPLVPATTGIYYTFAWGRVRFIVTDLRSFKSAKSTADSSTKTAMGSAQKTWFKNLITSSTEKVIFFLSETPWNSPNSTGDDDWGSFNTERTELANHIAATGKRVIVLAGDMHAIAYDSGANSQGGLPIFQAAPFYQTASIKGGTFSGGAYPASGTAVTQQYGRIAITDTGGTVTVAFTGYGSDNTVRKSYSLTV